MSKRFCQKCKVNRVTGNDKWCGQCKRAYHERLRDLGNRLRERKEILERPQTALEQAAADLGYKIAGEEFGCWSCRESNLDLGGEHGRSELQAGSGKGAGDIVRGAGLATVGTLEAQEQEAGGGIRDRSPGFVPGQGENLDLETPDGGGAGESDKTTPLSDSAGWLPDSLRGLLTPREADLFRLGVNYGKGLAFSKRDFRKLHAFKLFRMGLVQLKKEE